MGSELKVLTTGQVRYPDASVICTGADETSDMMEPKIVFEVLSPSTSLTDRRVKALEYANKASIQVYAILETERPEITVSRRATGWETEIIAGIEAMLPLPEIDIGVPLAAIHAC